MTSRGTAPAPLFRDPIHDGAADPTVVWNHQEQAWWMYYTNRRANAPGQGFAWVHGSAIGVANSTDGGMRWTYRGTIDLDFEPGHNTHWAPEVICNEGRYHLFLSYIRGIPHDWNAPRRIVRYISDDGWRWTCQGTIPLPSDRPIDACVAELPGGGFRLWYKDEADRSAIHAADSADLVTWRHQGVAVEDEPSEGPNVFSLGGCHWLVCDAWKGLSVYRSDDLTRWQRQPGYLLGQPGQRTDDGHYGHHTDVVVHRGRGLIFYHVHPGLSPGQDMGTTPGDWTWELARSSIQVAELSVVGDVLHCNRDQPVLEPLAVGTLPATAMVGRIV